MHSKLFVIRILSILSSVCAFYQCFSQGIAIGQWRDHLPYFSGQSVTSSANHIYYTSQYGMFKYNQSTAEIERMSKISGLTDIGYSSIRFDSETNTLIIAYKNSNIDLVKPEGVINLNDILRKNIPGNKNINHIEIKDGLAYLSCGFGIVVVDLKKNEIKDTYIIGRNGESVNVFNVTFNDEKMFAATAEGLLSSDYKTVNLSDFNNWNFLPEFGNKLVQGCMWYNNKLYTGKQYNLAEVSDTLFIIDNGQVSALSFPFFSFVGFQVGNNHLLVKSFSNLFLLNPDNTYESLYTYGETGTIHPNDVVQTKDGFYWIADRFAGLAKVWNNWQYEKISVNGAPTIFSAQADSYNGKIIFGAGRINAAWNPTYSVDGSYLFENETWKQNPGGTIGVGAETKDVRDILDVQIDRQNPNKYYAASFGNGIVEYENEVVKNVYDEFNSSLQLFTGTDFVFCSGMTQDNEGNLWITNSSVTNPISVKQPNGKWKSFFLGSNMQNTYCSDLVIDDFGNKWIVLPKSGGMAVFNENATIDNPSDDKYKRLTTSIGFGNLPSTEVFSIAKDNNGEIWVGGDKGIFVFYSPADIFSTKPSDAQQILVTQDGIAQYLLESEVVTAIAVDGANRKWIGTRNAGVFLMSPDGTQEIKHFTAQNSPLFSNEIVSIVINQQNGEVFFATANGIVSYRSDASEGTEEIEKTEVMAFPNPVNPGYTGSIAIKGLTTNADVRITDSSGGLVKELKANGGTAIWDGNTHVGNRAQSGIYLVFSTNEDGKQSIVTRILLMN